MVSTLTADKIGQNIDSIRAQFPALAGEQIYFDGPGGAQVPNMVLTAMRAYLETGNSNLGGSSRPSVATTELLDQARIAGQVLVNASRSDCIVFGANMTSLTFQLSRSIANQWQSSDEVIVSSLDHDANITPWVLAAKDKNVICHQVGLNQDKTNIDLEHLASLLSPKTKLVALTYASNAIGSIVDLKKVIEMVHSVGAQVYIDAVHYAPHGLMDVQALGCDYLVCSAYKFYGPHLGLAYIAPEHLNSLIPYKLRAAKNIGAARFETGTQNFEALSGFIATLDYLSQWGEPLSDKIFATRRARLAQSFAHIQAYETKLSQYFLTKLRDFPNIVLHGEAQADPTSRTPTFALSCHGISAQSLSEWLADDEIYTWSGHFYALDLIKQIEFEEDEGVLRVGLMHYNKREEIDALFEALAHLTR